MIVIPNNTTVSTFAGGTTGEPAKNLVYRVSFGGTWAVNETYVFNIVTAANTIVCGSGNLTKIVPTAILTYGNRVHMIAGSTWYFSDNNDATNWDEQAAGAGFIELSNQYSMPEPLVALTPYQGLMALQSRRTTQIWQMDPNPANFSLVQVLANIGTIASLGTQPLGELDVLFPYDSGIRGLRARVASLNAITTDIGSAVDSFVVPLLQAAGIYAANCCAIVEPSQNRYWLFIPNANLTDGMIYVLSYFPSNKIIAWSRYTPRVIISGTSYAFAPQKFVVWNGQVYICDASRILIYGGSDNATYDASQASLQVPFYDEKRPGHLKQATAVDVDVTGTWTIYGTPDWINSTKQTVGNAAQATFDNGKVGYEDEGTHFSFQLQTTSASDAKVSSIIFYYQLGNEGS